MRALGAFGWESCRACGLGAKDGEPLYESWWAGAYHLACAALFMDDRSARLVGRLMRGQRTVLWRLEPAGRRRVWRRVA